MFYCTPVQQANNQQIDLLDKNTDAAVFNPTGAKVWN